MLIQMGLIASTFLHKSLKILRHSLLRTLRNLRINRISSKNASNKEASQIQTLWDRWIQIRLLKEVTFTKERRWTLIYREQHFRVKLLKKSPTRAVSMNWIFIRDKVSIRSNHNKSTTILNLIRAMSTRCSISNNSLWLWALKVCIARVASRI